MPQMNPIWWVPLFIMFILILLLVNPLNYFNKTNLIRQNLSSTFSPKKQSWKW